VTNEPTPVTTVLEEGVTNGFVMRDGSAVVYNASQTLRRKSLAAGGSAAVTIADGVRRILDVSRDQSTVLFHSLAGRPVDGNNPSGERYVDLRTVATNGAGGAPMVLVDTERAIPLMFSATGAHALYFANGPRFNAVAVDGSGERSMLIDFNGIESTPSGSAAVLSTNGRQHGQMTVFDLVLADFTMSGQGNAMVTKPIVDGVPPTGFRFGIAAPKKIAYVRVTGSGLALYSRELP
jgi:hypothetical protein